MVIIPIAELTPVAPVLGDTMVMSGGGKGAGVQDGVGSSPEPALHAEIASIIPVITAPRQSGSILRRNS